MPLLLLLTGGLIGLPILLHLILKQEPKRVRFPALRFLKLTQQTTQRKLRLKHLLLMALRMLLIGLFGLALFQPRIPSFFSEYGLDFSGDRPIAAVILIDTTPSMGYLVEKRTRLQDAVSRALELLDSLPSQSRVAILTTNEPIAEWQPSLADAKLKLQSLVQPDGAGQPLTTILPRAYRLFTELEREESSENRETMPRLVALFGDRMVSSWQTERVEELKATASRLAQPNIAYLFFDVGIDEPANVGIVAAEAKPVLAPSGSNVTVSATLLSVGRSVPAARVELRSNLVNTPWVQDVALPQDVPTPVLFTLSNLPTGEHQLELVLPTPDNLGPEGVPGFDNIRYLTVRVGQGRKLLTITDDPDDAIFWQLAHKNKGEFTCEIVSTTNVTDLSGYEFVTLMSVADPTKPGPDGRTLWAKLQTYLERGGKLLIAPGGLAELNLTSYDPNGAAAGIMPGRITKLQSTESLPAPPEGSNQPDRRNGVSWYLGDDRALQHPLLAPIKTWKLSGNVNFLLVPRRAWNYWIVETSPEQVVVYYDDQDNPAERSPAIIEKTFPSGGKVLLLTTRLDSPWDSERKWNDYYDTTENAFGVVFPNLLAKYLSGETSDITLDFVTGQTLRLPLPTRDDDRAKKLLLEGPNVSPDDATIVFNSSDTFVNLSPERTNSAGNYRLVTEDRAWAEGFSLNVDARETQLSKASTEAIESLTGPDSIIATNKELDLNRLLVQKSSDLALMPLLLILLLIFFLSESIFANRFYRRVRFNQN